jgi:hypothetical protein
LSRIFVLDEFNLEICQVTGLYGVPDTPRAARELADVRTGELVFFYTTDSKQIHGVYRTRSPAFMEQHPERGPWVKRSKDKRMKYYPFRIEIEPVKAYRRALGVGALRKFRQDFTQQRIRRGSSVVYLDETDTKKLRQLLSDLNDR